MKKSSQTTIILTLVILPPFVIFLSRELFDLNYLTSSLYKVIFLTPFLYRVWIEKKTIKQGFLEHFSWATFKKNYGKLFLFGLGLAGIYGGSFLVFKNYLDLEYIADNLQAVMDLNLSNLIFIGLYIIFVNSLLEEYFWRGFLFDKLTHLATPWLAYALTGIAFSFHHVVFYYNWFSPTFFWLATIGLIGYAVIMSYVFSRYRDLYSCWLVHAMVDVIQISIAFFIFI